MRKTLFWSAVLVVCLACLWAVAGIPGQEQAQALPSKAGMVELAQQSAGPIPKADMNFGRMPLYFIPNQGQMDERVSYYVQGKDKSIYFGPGEVTFSLSKPAEKAKEKVPSPADRLRGKAVPSQPSERWTVKLEFVGADAKIMPVAEDKTGAVISYFKGKPENWKTGLPTYSRIVYRNLWPGIDLAYSGMVNRLKYEFIVHPGADPSKIRLRYRGAEKVALNAEGRLEVTTPVASFQDEIPQGWQDVKGVRHNVEMSYDLKVEPAAAAGGRRHDFCFKVGNYDKTQILILDPASIVYCGYIGGTLSEGGLGICVDSNRNAYVVGRTDSNAATFPVSVGPDLIQNGDLDAFVAKVNASGTGLVYCGYIGGAGHDYANAVAVNGAGNAYIVGQTDSNETSFPVLVGPDLSFNGSGGGTPGGDAFVAKVNASGTALLYCGYIGGSADELATGVAVDSLGRAYICGDTESPTSTFPVAVGPDLTLNGSRDAFVAKVNASGSGLVYCGYIGGESIDGAHAIAVDSSGNSYIAGYTQSNEKTFPLKYGPDLTFNGTTDAFVAKVNASGTGFVYSGYIGGALEEYAFGIAVDSAGLAYVAGITASDEFSFPVGNGPDLTYNGGEYDGFVARVYASGVGLDYCGYIGGAGIDHANGIAVDSRGCAYVVGETESDQSTFPIRRGPASVHQGFRDAYIAKVGSSGRGLTFCGYIGGNYDDFGQGVAADARMNAYVAGTTSSSEYDGFPVRTGPDITFNGLGTEAYVAKILYINEVSVVIPIGGERWVVGSIHKISWTTEDKKGSNKIECSTNKGQTWFTVAASTPDDGSFNWTIPNKPSVACLIRITQKENGQYDQSDNPFAIEPKPKITVVSPNGGEIWTRYDQRTIQWTTAGTVGAVKIEYSKNGGTSWTVVVASTPNTGSYMWVVPNTPSNNCLVRIKEAADGSPMDKSNAKFKILPAAN